MFHKVKTITPCDDFLLLATFESGEIKKYDVKPLFARWPAFQTLHSVNGLFAGVQVDAGGYGISWNDELDLSCDELWENGISFGDDKIAS